MIKLSVKSIIILILLSALLLLAACSIIHFTISVDYNSAMGIVSGHGKHEKDTLITISASAKEGYYFESWKENDEIIEASNELNFISDKNYKLEAIFKPLEFIISAKPENFQGGFVIGSGSYRYGDVATIIATPSEEYIFHEWLGEHEWMSILGNQVQFAVFEDINVTALFIKEIED
jgi:hypothetical protein